MTAKPSAWIWPAAAWVFLACSSPKTLDTPSGRQTPASGGGMRAASPDNQGNPEAIAELYARSTPGGTVTAHFLGVRPTAEQGEPVPPLSFGVQRLEFSFSGDPKRYVFRPHGTLFFSDWSFDVFSPRGTYAALPQDRFGPYHIVSVPRLRAYLDQGARPDDVVAYWPHPKGFTPVHAKLRWLSDSEIEFEAQGETIIIIRHSIGGPAPVLQKTSR